MKKVFLIILHFGDVKITQKCIESILRYEKEFEEIIVVDNTNKLKIESGELRINSIKIIRNNDNLGYAGGMNKGIEYAMSKKTDYILLLNNDILFEKPILKALIKHIENKKEVGIIGPSIKFVRDSETIYDMGGKVNMLFGRTSHNEVNENEMLKPNLQVFDSEIARACGTQGSEFTEGRVRYDRVVEADYVSGCCMLIKNDVFMKVGLFDEMFFLYYEDVDFCLRAKKAGFKTIVLPDVYVFHNLSQTVGKISSLGVSNQIKSALIFGKKHVGNMFLNKLFVFFQCFVLLLKKPEMGIIAFKILLYK